MPLPNYSPYQQAGEAAGNLGNSLSEITLQLAKQRYQQQMLRQQMMLKQQQLYQQNMLNQAHMGAYNAQSNMNMARGARFQAQAQADTAKTTGAQDYGNFAGLMAQRMMGDTPPTTFRPQGAPFGPVSADDMDKGWGDTKDLVAALASPAFRSAALAGQPSRGPDALRDIIANLMAGPMSPDRARAIQMGEKPMSVGGKAVYDPTQPPGQRITDVAPMEIPAGGTLSPGTVPGMQTQYGQPRDESLAGQSAAINSTLKLLERPTLFNRASNSFGPGYIPALVNKATNNYPTGLRPQGQAQPNAVRPLDPDTASQFLQQAGGDKNKARQMARDAGYTF